MALFLINVRFIKLIELLNYCASIVAWFSVGIARIGIEKTTRLVVESPP